MFAHKMPSSSKQTRTVRSRPRRRRSLPVLAASAALLASVLLTSVAIAGGGGIGGGGGGGGGDGDGEKYTFPIIGSHSYGDGFGAGRNHQGQDVFAKCGKDLVAVRSGKVQVVDKHSAAGHYIVLDIKDSKLDFAYMHLKKQAIVREGRRVGKGQKIGAVGESGNASGCHLHFEKWSAPGYYEGGSPMASVTRSLKKWDEYS